MNVNRQTYSIRSDYVLFAIYFIYLVIKKIPAAIHMVHKLVIAPCVTVNKTFGIKDLGFSALISYHKRNDKSSGVLRHNPFRNKATVQNLYFSLQHHFILVVLVVKDFHNHFHVRIRNRMTGISLNCAGNS